jgi:prepilin-type N-terminal cleavage/methylation domain-containing protein
MPTRAIHRAAAGFTLLELMLALAATAALLALAAGAVRDATAARDRTALRTTALARTEDALQALRDDLATADANAVATAGVSPATLLRLARREPAPMLVTWGLEDGRLVRRERIALGDAAAAEPERREVKLDGVDGLTVRCAGSEGWTAECTGPVQAIVVELQPASGAPLLVHVRLAGRRS